MDSSLSAKNKKLTIKHMAVSDLKPAVYNPRKISDKDFAQLVESIRQYSLVEPLVVNSLPERYGTVIGGHQRLKAAVHLGYKTVPVVFISLDKKLERALNLRLNRNTGEFDLDLLKHFDVDELLSVGFDDIDLGDIWNVSLDIEDDNFDEEKAVKKARTTDIKPGDMFALGKHRLICGDATDPAVIKRLVGDLKPSLFYSDPPYNISLDYDKGVSNKASYGGQTRDTKTDVEYASFLGAALANALAVMDENTHIFMYCDQTYIGLLQILMAQHGLTNRRVCLWIKNGFSPVPDIAFNKACEACVYATLGTPYLSDINNLTEILNKDVAPGNRAIDDIVDIFDIWLAKREPGQEYQHPTQKPLTLHEKDNPYLIERSTNSKDDSAMELLKRVAFLSVDRTLKKKDGQRRLITVHVNECDLAMEDIGYFLDYLNKIGTSNVMESGIQVIYETSRIGKDTIPPELLEIADLRLLQTVANAETAEYFTGRKNLMTEKVGETIVLNKHFHKYLVNKFPPVNFPDNSGPFEQ